MLQYCSGIAHEFASRRNRVRNFVTNHNLSSGTANETILRNFLAQMSSGRYKVGQGFIYQSSESIKVSKQCDIMVYDHQDYPLVHSESGIDIVFPEAARMVIEVKTKLTSKNLKDALENIASAKSINFSINGVVFAFQSLKESTIIENLRIYAKDLDIHQAPIAILILDKGIIIHRWPGTELGGLSNTFCIRKSKNEMVIAFLLLHFFDVEMQGIWGGAAIQNLLQKMLDEHTTQYDADIIIGT